jgi:transcriptional regulator GlxA family with amidase domain
VTELVARSDLPERTFKRRFTTATGYSPIAYVQHVRVEEAKRRLERTAEPVDEISYAVGYEDPPRVIPPCRSTARSRLLNRSGAR